MFMYSYNQYSNSAKLLSEALSDIRHENGRSHSVRRIKHNGSRFRGNANKTVINWGSSSLPEEVMKCRVINDPVIVGKCSNKLHFFEKVNTLTDVSIPEWTTESTVARFWLNEGFKVVARTVLRGHSGEGIVIMEEEDDLVDAPLYTKYIPKKDEYRVHVVRNPDDEIYYSFDIARKAIRSDFPEGQVNHQVRNHANGFIYRRQEIDVPGCVDEVAIAVMEGLGLDFGAVDVIYNKRQDKAYVLEVNTAPGLEGSTVESYAKMIEENFR